MLSFRIARPQISRPPAAPPLIAEWLPLPDLDDPNAVIQLIESRNDVIEGVTVTVRFEESDARVTELARWRVIWNAWADAERPAREAMTIFEKFYDLKGRIERESERVGDSCWAMGDCVGTRVLSG